MFSSVQRVPRNYFESEEWTPDWRNRQAMAYQMAFRTRVLLAAVNDRSGHVATALLREVKFPEWENDPIVKARFWHAVGAPIPDSQWTKAFDRMQGCVKADPIKQSTVALKGWILAGLSDEEISDRRPLPPFYIRVYHDTWFDVRGHMQWPQVLTQVLCMSPMNADTPQWERRERTVMRAAIADGAGAVDRLVVPADKISTTEVEWLLSHRSQVQSRMAWDRTMVNSSHGEGRQGDIMIHQEDYRTSINKELARSKMDLGNKGDEKYLNFFDELTTVWEKHGAVSDDEEFFASGLEDMKEPEREKIQARRVG